MREKDFIAHLQSHLDSVLPVPVLTDPDGERPVPVVIIDDWDSEDQGHHNSAYTGEQPNTADQNYERYLTFDFKTRVEWEIRHNEQVSVSSLKDSLKHEIRLISQFPQEFHEDIKRCDLGSGGNPTSEFVEPRESELMFSASFYGDHTVALTDGDTIESIRENLSLN